LDEHNASISNGEVYQHTVLKMGGVVSSDVLVPAYQTMMS